MIRTVLVPLDGSKAAEAVIPYVQLIASRTGAAVHLLTVVHDENGATKAAEARAYLEDRAAPLPRSTASSSRWTGHRSPYLSSPTWRSWRRRSAPASSSTTPSFLWTST